MRGAGGVGDHAVKIACALLWWAPLWWAMLCNAQTPEIVALTRAFPGLRPLVRSEPLRAEFLGSVRASTWHSGCPVSPEDLRVLTVSYWSFGGTPAHGELVVNREVAAEVRDIFTELFEHGFLIEKMQPVEEFGGNDDRSMEANNTSAYNCRDVTGVKGKFSNHSWGRAIDINPLTNPYVKGEKVLPAAGRGYLDRARAYPGGILADSFAVKAFAKRGWAWGGQWTDRQDYQHFEKPDKK